MRLRTCFLFIILLSTGLVYAQEPGEPAVVKGYMLGPGDQIAGNVNTEIGYEFVTTVDENGMVYLPFIEKPIVAQCRTETEVRDDIEAEIRKYIREPRLNFRIADKKSRPPVTVYGEINKPSEITLTRKATLLELLAATGGAKEQEASGLVEVRRPRTPLCMADGDPDNWKTNSSRTFRLADINAGKADSNPVIYPGDMILVQRASPVYITGEVVAPQGVFLKERGLSLTEGLAQVGNIREGAKKTKISIWRLKPGASLESRDRADQLASAGALYSHDRDDLADPDVEVDAAILASTMCPVGQPQRSGGIVTDGHDHAPLGLLGGLTGDEACRDPLLSPPPRSSLHRHVTPRRHSDGQRPGDSGHRTRSRRRGSVSLDHSRRLSAFSRAGCPIAGRCCGCKCASGEG